MKRSKKLLAVVLAMVMAFSLMAVTAAAYDAGHEHDCAVCSEEGIQPRRPTKICGKCQVEMTYIEIGSSGHREYYFECPKCHTTMGTLPVRP